MVIRLNNSDTSYVIFIVFKELLSSVGSMTRTYLMAVFWSETGTDFIFLILNYNCKNSAPLMSKLVVKHST